MSRSFDDGEGKLEIFTIGIDDKKVLFNGIGLKMSTVCDMIQYIMTNTDLEPDDHRKNLRSWFRHLRIGQGFNPGEKRYHPK